MPGLEVKRLSYARPPFSLSLDLELPASCFGVLLGPSGCGKSTALRLIAGLEEAESGQIFLGGRDISHAPPEKRRIGLVFQDFALFTHLSVRKNIEYGLRIAGKGALERKAKVEAIAEAFHIAALLERMPQELSGGEQQRVALARSIAAEPELILLDEPLSSLDASLRRELRLEILSRVKEAGISAILVTHDVEEALSMADRLFLMEGGRIRAAGRPEELYERPDSLFAARLLGSGSPIPIRAWGKTESGLLARTALGDFACEAGLAKPEGGSPLALGYFIHLKREGGSLLAELGDSGRSSSMTRGRASEKEGKEGAVIKGRIVSLAYVGGRRRVVIEAEETMAEIDLWTGARMAPGDRISVLMPPSSYLLIAPRADRGYR